ncbi:PemI [Clostridium gasigenes]|uniref:PemI n=1 Tax=Clostridium gasigenes TaxID=94869 RepID=UPI001C0D1BD1|nr:PemI [Clostridium gasigenes]MBU3134612.1 PemI [Clostridium gasigenes]
MDNMKFLTKGKINFNTSGSGSVSAKLLIPVDIIKFLEITENDRNIDFILKDGSIIIQKRGLI